MDESPFKILKTNKNGYIWVLRSNNGIYYQYELTKSGKVAQEIIGNYKGIVVTDGFGAYRRILKPPNVLLAGCWAHVRRRFYDSIDTSEEATEIVSIIDKLFDIEHKAKSFDELRILRQQESLKLIEKLERIFLEVKDYYVKAFPIRKAMAYFYKNREELLLFLTNPEVPLSNNGSERATKAPY